MERIRAATAVPAEESAPPEVMAVEPAVAAPISLGERVEVVASPGVTREDVESLLDGLSAPLAPGESTRQRADQLLRLLQDEALGDLTDSNERQVRPLALEALIGLGFPYALEVPPDVLAEMRGSVARALSRSSRWGLGLAGVNALVPVMGQVVSTSPGRWWYDTGVWNQLEGPAILAGVLFLPAALSALGERYRQKWLKYLGNGALVLMSTVGFIPGIIMSRDGFTPDGATFLGMGLALLMSAICLRHRPEPGE
ncbi:hypothetical protein [Archangium sp.]|uniref:hypothetical protein n=1 Tax=Archangium sp. TaxID=1872627 RepID=UPI00389B289D